MTDLQIVCVRTVEGNILVLYFQNELKMLIKHSYEPILFQFFYLFFFLLQDYPQSDLFFYSNFIHLIISILYLLELKYS